MKNWHIKLNKEAPVYILKVPVDDEFIKYLLNIKSKNFIETFSVLNNKRGKWVHISGAMM